MLPKLLTSIFGSRNDRLLKQYRQVVQKVNALEASFEQLSDTELRAKTDEFRQPRRRRRDARRAAARGVRRRARGEQADAEDAPLRRPADRRHGAARRQDRRDAHRRGQDADGDAAGLPQLARRQGRARRHRQRLPGAARRRMDGAALHLPRPDASASTCRSMSKEDKQAAYAADVTYGTNNEFGFDYLRDNMVQDTADRVARGLLVRDRRRGRLDPDRRGAHAAHHQRPGRRPHRDVRAHQRRRPEAEEADRRARPAHRRRRDRAGRLHRRREDAPGLPHRRRPRARRAAAARRRPAGRGREPVRPGQHHADAPRVRGAARASTSTTATSTTSSSRARTASPRSSSSTSSPAA